MGPHAHIDEEAVDADDEARLIRPYHDNPSDSDSIDSPLRRNTPTIELSGSHRHTTHSWQDRIADRIPPGIQRAWAATKKWVKGPQPPRIYTITPYFPKVQHTPLAVLDHYAPRKTHRALLLALIYAAWLLSFSLALWRSSFAAQIPGYGSPTRLSCSAKYWSDGNGCGINGDQCRPFSNQSMAFRCPANCNRVLALDPHAVGDRELVYKAQVIGGPVDYQTGFSEDIVDNAVYRGDSFICASAAHAGFINDLEGGCGVVALTGEQPSFSGEKQHSLESTPFPSYFPKSFGFLSGTKSQCKDLRWAYTCHYCLLHDCPIYLHNKSRSILLVEFCGALLPRRPCLGSSQSYKLLFSNIACVRTLPTRRVLCRDHLQVHCQTLTHWSHSPA
jgi:hypothetical protein